MLLFPNYLFLFVHSVFVFYAYTPRALLLYVRVEIVLNKLIDIFQIVHIILYNLYTNIYISNITYYIYTIYELTYIFQILHHGGIYNQTTLIRVIP